MRDQDKDKDLDLPSFGPAEREPEIGSATGKQKPAHAARQSTGSSAGSRGHSDQVVTSGSSGNSLSYLIILLLAAAVGGLAYWNFMQHQQLLTLEQQRSEMDGKVLELQQLLQVAESSAAQSGETLLGQVKNLQSEVAKQGKAATEKYKQIDSEIGKLWVVAHQRNTPKIAELEKQLQEMQSLTEKQAATIKKLDGGIASLTQKLKTVESEGNKSAEQIASIKQTSASLNTEFQILQESVELQQAEQRKKLSAFAEQIVNLQSNQNASAVLERRVKVNEQAVKAIDGSRILLNKELLQIRQKLNNLQLKVEQL